MVIINHKYNPKLNKEEIGILEQGQLCCMGDTYYFYKGEQVGNFCFSVNLLSGEEQLTVVNNKAMPLSIKCISSDYTKNGKRVKLKKLKVGDTFIYNHHWFIVSHCWWDKIQYLDVITRKFIELNPKTKVEKIDFTIAI